MTIEDVTKPQSTPHNTHTPKVWEPTESDKHPSALPLADLISGFRGNPYRFLAALLIDPDASYTQVLRSIGCATPTLYQWRREIPGFKECIEQIKRETPTLKQQQARLYLLEKAPDIARKMAERALSDGKDAQRAAERSLEAAGVLGAQAQSPEGASDLASIALRIWARRNSKVGVVIQAE